MKLLKLGLNLTGSILLEVVVAGSLCARVLDADTEGVFVAVGLEVAHHATEHVVWDEEVQSGSSRSVVVACGLDAVVGTVDCAFPTVVQGN